VSLGKLFALMRAAFRRVSVPQSALARCSPGLFQHRRIISRLALTVSAGGLCQCERA
jgi:hypothetical protein